MNSSERTKRISENGANGEEFDFLVAGFVVFAIWFGSFVSNRSFKVEKKRGVSTPVHARCLESRQMVGFSGFDIYFRGWC